MAQSHDIKMIVLLVADGLLRRESETAVVEKLVEAGIPPSDAPTVYRDVKLACQQGVQAVITDGLSAPNGPPRDPLLAEAFRVGQASMRGTVRTVWLRRAITLLIILSAIAATIWLFER
jgi:hypothetical protein